MRSVIDVVDLSKDELYDLMQVALDIKSSPEKYSDRCKGKKLATLFYEPSTRTRLSFTAAMLELGGSVLGFSGAGNSSAAKGESVADTAKVVSYYADIIAIRSDREGAALVASRSASIPVINAGDGSHCHPTQTLADLLTIYSELGRLNNITVGYCGDLKYGRTVHSLLGALAREKGVNVVLISPEELKLPDYVKSEVLEKNGISYVETADLEKVLPTLDVLYMTRVQRERFSDGSQYERLKDSYILTAEKMKLAKDTTIVLHPLPRVNEISVKVDDDKRACYFKQVENGKYMRMALILKLLDDAKKLPQREDAFAKLTLKKSDRKCANPKCITATEQELEQIFKEDGDGLRCVYCENKL